MIDPVAGWSDGERVYAEAMVAELDWAPLHFDGWGHYERARPVLPGETIEVIGRWPEESYVLQYRPMLGELVAARQFPIDRFPEVTVLGLIDDGELPELRSLASLGLIGQLSDAATQLARSDRTIPTEPLVATGSTIPAHAEIPVHYLPADGRWLDAGRLIHEDHRSAVYAIAGHWGLRPGAPVGLTPTGFLVFEPFGLDGVRLTIEHPVSQPVGPRLIQARVASTDTTASAVGIRRQRCGVRTSCDASSHHRLKPLAPQTLFLG